ncbi:MAG: hypothetical protein AUI47_12200 [Acidobacteria bacterium 13_1_40CM_2_68_5]|nr:MAG: hypothetical protein AUI47_12200 [Acidobacteria bacterium 13_1_40CM_2_68_5]
MRHTKALLTLAVLGLGTPAPGQGRADLVLLDAPRGAWLATVKEGAAVTVLEERDGWRRVRVEGWTMAPAGAPPDVSVQPPPAGPSALPGAAPTGARVRGVLAPDIRSGGSAGANLLVLLVRESAALLADHRRAGEDCRARVGDKDREIEGLRTDLEGALNSSDNFREATTRNDRTRTRLRAAERERQLIVQECRGKAQDIFERAAVQRAISDGGGRFEFEGVEPGRYGVVALEPSGERPRSWTFECLIAGAEARVLDPSADRAGFEADWGLR